MFIKKAILRFLVCFAAVFSASPFFLSRSVRADATGCLAADVSIYDADSGKRLDGGFYADLKAILYENGVRVKELSNMSGPQYRPRFLIGMDESSHFQAGHPLKLGNQYAFELIIPSGYTLDQIKLNKNYEGEPLPKAYKVSGNRITFIYDKEIQKQIQKPGVGGGFEVYYYLRKCSGSSSQGATKINLPKTEYKVTAGAKAFNLNAKVVNGSALTYHSSRPSVISVNKKGRITVKKPGQAVITVKSKANHYGCSQENSLRQRGKPQEEIPEDNLEKSTFRIRLHHMLFRQKRYEELSDCHSQRQPHSFSNCK